MTAEGAGVNLEAVALAADSAVTVARADDGPTKGFTSANKIFALSSVAPVGILVYGAANFAGIPWETLIKEYRRINREKVFDSLPEHADDFRHFLLSGLSSYHDAASFSSDAGIAIAGFGVMEFFPSLSTLQVHTEGDQTDIQEVGFTKIDISNSSAVIPFAQRDLIDQFIRGTSSECDKYLIALVANILISSTSNIIDTLGTEYPDLNKAVVFDSVAPSFYSGLV